MKSKRRRKRMMKNLAIIMMRKMKNQIKKEILKIYQKYQREFSKMPEIKKKRSK